MKYRLYLFALILTVSACKNKKAVVEANKAPTIQQKEAADKERQMAIAEQMKSEKLPSPGKDHHRHAAKQMPADAIARIQRTACFGRCPVYTLTVFKNGSVEYVGERFVPREGKYTAQVDKVKIEALLARASLIGFNKFEDIYDKEAISDVPSTITSLRGEEGLKIVVNRFNAPKELSRFELYFDDLFKDVEWE